MGILIKDLTIKHGYDIRICQDTFLHILVDNCISCHLLTLPNNRDIFNIFAYVNTIAFSIKKTTHVQIGYTVASASGSYLYDCCDIENWKIRKKNRKNVVIFESINEFDNFFVRWLQPRCLNENITPAKICLDMGINQQCHMDNTAVATALTRSTIVDGHGDYFDDFRNKWQYQ